MMMKTNTSENNLYLETNKTFDQLREFLKKLPIVSDKICIMSKKEKEGKCKEEINSLFHFYKIK